jgi:metal transporter CNNM
MEVFYIVASLFLVVISAICSGLNIGLMSLDAADLKRKAQLGDERAKKLLPFRSNSHLSLASILFTNVGVISATSLLLGQFMVGLAAGVISTITIVIFGEILPQSYFARNALNWSAALAPVLRVMIILTYPIAKPLQLLLDKLVGDQLPGLHTRDELGLLIAEHNNSKSELDGDEIEIIKGALQLSQKQVADIMTPIENVTSVQLQDVIGGELIDELKHSGHSRIPIFNKSKTACHGILLLKDMVDIDFDQQPTRVSDMQIRVTRTIGSRTALDTLFRNFISARAHLMPVTSSRKIIGIVTIEDLIEEILGHEIIDETDERTFA